MRILVTGSLGTIGTPLVRELKQRGHQVFGCDLAHHENETGPHFPTNGDYARCDVGEFRQLEWVVNHARPEMVYHAAAEFGRWNGEDFVENLFRTNAVGTKNVIRLQERLGFKLVHFSSSEVYGDACVTLRESLPPVNLLNDYAMTKWVNEQQIWNSAQLSGTQSVIVRLFNTYGPGEYYSPYRSVNCAFLYRAMTGMPLIVHRGHKRTSTYVDDTVRTLANIAASWHPGQTYNIAGNELHTIEQLADVALSCFPGSMSRIQSCESEPLTTTLKIADTTKAENDLDHKITVSLEDGMRRMAGWMKRVYANDQ